MTHRRPRLVTPFRYSLIAATACAYAASAGAAPVTWTSNASGLWTTAADWSSTPSLPGPADDVTINQPGPITVTLSSGTQSIHSLVVDNTLVIPSGSLAVATTLQVNGNLTVSGGTLLNATLSTAGSGAIALSGFPIFDGVTLASNQTVTNASLILMDGLTLSNTTLSLSTSSTLFSRGIETLGGTGIVEFDGTGTDTISPSATTTLTLGANITVQTGTSSGSISTDGLTNHGLISSQTSGKSITISSATFTNTGTLQTLNGATINISGGITPGGLGTFNSTGGTIQISGIFDNSNSTLALNGVGNSLLLSGTLKNGTLSIANSALLTFSGTPFFDGVTLASNLSMNSSTLFIKNGLTLSNVTLSLNNSSTLFVSGNQTLGGTGADIVQFDGTGINNISPSGASTLTTGANVTLQTGTGNATISVTGLVSQGLISAKTSGKIINISGTTFTNSGALQALNGATLAINSTNWSGSGTITLDTTSTLNLGGTFPTASLANLSRTGGTISITGTLDNTSSTFALNTATGSFILSGGTIKNGNLTFANGATLTFSGTPFFDGVTLASNLSITSSSLFIKDGLTLSNSTFGLNNASTLFVAGNQTLGGTGVIEFDGTGTQNISPSGPSTLTTGANVTIQTGAGSGTFDINGLINQGIISAQTSGKTITIGGGTSLTNTGTIQALNGGTIIIAGTITPAGLGTFNSTGGTIQISGTLDNTNSTLALNGVGNSLLLLNGTIKNGNLSIANGATLTFSGNPFFDGVTLTSNLSINSSILFIKDGLTLSNSTLSLSNATTFFVAGNQTLGGPGILEFDGTGTENISQSGTSTLTTGANVTIQTGTGNGNISINGLINQGIISAQTSGKTITINSTTFTNSGTLQTLNGGTINISSNLTTAQLGNFNSTGGTIQLSGILDNTNSTLALNGIGNSLLLTGSLKNGNLSIAGTATLHQSAGSVTISTLSQSGGNLSLGGIQALYSIPTITITGGTTTLTKDAFKVLTTTSLTFGGSTNAWTGDLDLTQNKLIFEATPVTKSAALTTLRNQALFGRANAAGITSSTSAASFAVAVLDNAVTNFSTFGGQPADTNSILISPELLGDANVDGGVTLTDLATILNNFGQATPAWTSGNFDGANTIDLTDLADVLNNFGQSNPNAHIATPEPTSLALLASSAALLLTRRRRNHSTPGNQ